MIFISRNQKLDQLKQLRMKIMGNQYHKEEIKVKLNQINTADDIMDLLGSGERPGTAERLQAFKIKKRKHTDQQVIQSKSQSQDLTE